MNPRAFLYVKNLSESLVPRLCLGTHFQRLCLAYDRENWRQSLRICVTRQSLVTNKIWGACLYIKYIFRRL